MGLVFGATNLRTCAGMSRGDSSSFLGAYTENEAVKKNPFAPIDQTGVGQFGQIAAEKDNKSRLGIELSSSSGRRTRWWPGRCEVCHEAGWLSDAAVSRRQTIADCAGRNGRVGKRSRRGGRW